MKHRRTIHVDIEDAGVLRGLSIDQAVEVRVRGKIVAVSSPDRFNSPLVEGGSDAPERVPGDITVQIADLRVRKRGNQITELDEALDDSDE